MKNPFVSPLLILPFDHRSSFAKGLLGFKMPLTNAQKKEVTELKKIVYEAFQLSLKKYSHFNWFGILLDEEYGASILREAKKTGTQVCLTTEKSGKEEYQFQYGSAFAAHINRFKPHYVKALVRWNPKNKTLNARQLKRLKKLSDFCHKNGYEFLFELLIIPTERDLKRAGGVAAFQKQVRPKMEANAIRVIQKTVDVDIWKLEGMAKAKWKLVLAAMKPNARVIVLGRGEDETHVRTWLRDAASFDQIIGFAVGRTVFAKPLKVYIEKRITKKVCIERISKNFSSLVRLWSKERSIKP